mmetsp:Transcript_62006/g.147908  ORF Transcript_62006/g.147908 Transcript_62006/m.147908 type:complete len:647 (-) Transcript_62006:250-2190(-)
MPSPSSLTAPLLAEKDEECGQMETERSSDGAAGESWRKALQVCYPTTRQLRKLLLHWFQTTTNEDYLQSPISRRRSWKWVWPVFNTLGLVSDAAALAAGSGNLSIVCADAALVLITLLVCVRYSFQLATVRADFVLGVSLLANYLWCNVQLASNPFALDTGSLSIVILLFSCLGIHSSVSLLTLGFGIVSQILLGRRLGDVIGVVFQLSVASASAVILEFCIACLFKDLQAKARCNQQLLDFATDGFGAVQSASWRLTQVSQKMAETFACSEAELIGRPLDELIDERDRGYVKTFLDDAAKGSAPAASLVTASAGGWQFEVRLMPYKIDADGAQIGFCMQLVGEMRAIETTSPAAQCGSLAAAGHQEGQPCPSDAEGEAMLACQSSADEQQPQELRCTAPSSSFVQQAEAMEASRPSRPLGTLSFSSWTISAPSVKDFNMRLKKKEMMTQATQTGETQRRRKPPAPLAAATGNLQCAAWQPGGGRGTGRQPKSRHRGTSSSGRQQGRLPDVRIEEGRPVLSRFSPTPRSTRGNCLNGLVKSFNITGPGCCSKHVGYMALYDVLLEELTGSCGNLTLNSDWQCPDCLSLSKWQEDVDSASDDDSGSAGLEQFCMMCGTVVENPILRAAIATAFQSSSSVEASASSVG